MFAVIYEFETIPGTESEFQEAWLELTEGIYQHYGSLGSRLHRSMQKANVFVGYARWPSREIWSGGKPTLPTRYQVAADRMKACLKRSETIYELEVSQDYLQPEPFTGL